MSPDFETIEFPQVVNWLKSVNGEFTLADATRYLCRGPHNTLASAMNLQLSLEHLAGSGDIEHASNRWGHYRKPDKSLIPIDITQTDETPVNLWLPFNASSFVKLFPGNIVVVSGQKDAGKTAVLFNAAYYNADKWNIHYFNSEMGPSEIKIRCSEFCKANNDTYFSIWKKVKFYERSTNFGDVIIPGEWNLNIIDFLENLQDFYRVGEYIRQIHDRLNGAICIIGMQQRDDKLPVGGWAALEKARLHLAITKDWSKDYPHKMKICVGKNWADHKINPVGRAVDYKIIRGGYLLAVTNNGKIWYEDNK